MLENFKAMATAIPDVVDYRSESGAEVWLFRQSCTPPVWGGYPRAGGEACPFGLVVDAEGTAVGGAALRFMSGQWASQGRKVDRKVHQDLIQGLLRKFLTHALSAEKPDSSELGLMLGEAISLPGVAVAPGKMTKRETALAVAVGVRPAHVSACEALGLRVRVESPESALTAYVSGGRFCAVHKGSWDAESHSLALTSGLRADVVEFLSAGGFGLHRVKV